MFSLHDAYAQAGIDPATVAVILHRPSGTRFRRALPWLVQSRPAAFETYQSFHNHIATATLKQRELAVSFVEVSPGRLAFVGVYRVAGFGERTYADILMDKEYRYLCEALGMESWFKPGEMGTQIWFNLAPVELMADLAGQLIISSPTGRTYMRLGENLNPKIRAIEEASQFAAPAPDWREVLLSGPEMRILPQAWTARLREWRGIYLIVDESDGQRYVGSAYGEANLFGRWSDHVAGSVGITLELRRRDPVNFQFSILERVSPDMQPEDVIALEHGWMNRLNTRQFGLNT